MRIWVTLTPKETDEGSRVGTAREMNARRIGAVNRRGYNGTPSESLLMHQKAARCELAAHIGLKTNYWNQMDFSQPDLDGWIDVKERYFFRHGLSISLKANVDYAFVSVCSEKAPTYAIDGWCYGHEIMHRANLRDIKPPRPPTYMLDPSKYVAPIKTPQQLMEIIKQRLGK